MLSLTVALKIHDTWGTYATVSQSVAWLPEIAGISPRKAETIEVFPSPVLPTMATKLPTSISRFMLDKVG